MNSDIHTTLCDISNIYIDKSLPPNERARKYINDGYNPYRFLVDGTVINISFNGEESLSSCLTRALDSMQYYTRTEQPPRVTRTYRAALYIRLSREDGDKTESDSVVNQKRLLTNFAQAQLDIESFKHYVDYAFNFGNQTVRLTK